jgi:hypothetical protein
MPLTQSERNAIKLEVFNAMNAYGDYRSYRTIYGSEPIETLDACAVLLSKPLAFQRQLLLMVAERQVFTYSSGGTTYSYQERCRDTGGAPHIWGTDSYSGEGALTEIRNNTINQSPPLYRCIFVGIYRPSYAKYWAHWVNISGYGTLDPNQNYNNMGLLNYDGSNRWNANHSDRDWGSLRDFIVGTISGGNITYGLLPQLWVDAIDAMEPQGVTGTLLQIKSPPPVYIFSLDAMPSFDKNTFVMVDLLEETPPATFQSLLATKVKLRGKATVFNALYQSAEKDKKERKRIVVNTSTESYSWDNTSYTWTRQGDASTGREIIYETKNYLTLSQAMNILNNL